MIRFDDKNGRSNKFLFLDLFFFQGQLDKETLDLIRRPRCGLADFDPNRLPRPHSIGNRRKRRYVLQGQKWSKTYLTYK